MKRSFIQKYSNLARLHKKALNDFWQECEKDFDWQDLYSKDENLNNVPLSYFDSKLIHGLTLAENTCLLKYFIITRFTVNPCARVRPKSDPYEIWSSGNWTWRVLKKWQKNDDAPFARWYCLVESPFTPEGEYGDCYVSDIKPLAKRIK